MNFKETIITNELDEANYITISSFLDKVQTYNSLDHALIELPTDYLEFYSKNEKTLNKAVSKLFENYNPESPGYLGLSPTPKIVTKKIKYKGQILLLTFDPEVGVWIALPGFRSITQALKHGKQTVDQIKENSKL